MKTEWVHKKLGDCCESELGKTLDEGRNTGLYRPYLCALNVLWGKIDISIIKQMRIEDSELERYLVKKGDLLVCEGGEIGRCAIWENDDEIYYQNALHRVRFYKEYDAYFFMYLLCHYNDLKLIEQYGKGLTIKHLNQTAFRNIPVCVPDLSAQRRIAAILASADKVIDSTRRLIEKYKKMKQGMMEELFNEQCTMNNGEWARKTLIELADYYNGMAFKPSDWENDGTKIIRIEQLNNPLGKYDYYKGCFSETNAIHNGDLIFSWSATLKVVIWQWGDGVLNQHLFKVVPASNVDKHFLYYLLDYNMPKLGESSHGSTMKHIKRKELETYTAYIPRKIAEQKRIASILSSIDSKIECEQSILNKYIQVKKGLMDKLLNE